MLQNPSLVPLAPSPWSCVQGVSFWKNTAAMLSELGLLSCDLIIWPNDNLRAFAHNRGVARSCSQICLHKWCVFCHASLCGHCVRAVKEMDSKSIGLCPQGFESPRCRFIQLFRLPSLTRRGTRGLARTFATSNVRFLDAKNQVPGYIGPARQSGRANRTGAQLCRTRSCTARAISCPNAGTGSPHGCARVHDTAPRYARWVRCVLSAS